MQNIFVFDFERFDETVKAINTGSFGQTPKHSVSADGQHLRELVNPNIMQAAPEVGANKLLLNTLYFLSKENLKCKEFNAICI